MSDRALPVPDIVASPIRPAYAFAAAGAIVGMVGVIALGNDLALDFVHVMTGVLWTGIDLFMGFVVGPIIRRLPFEARRAFISALMPRMIFLMPTLSIITGTAGWFLAERRGYLALGYPEFWWVLAALAILAVLTVQGLGILLPTNLRVYFEMQKAAPDDEKIGRLMRRYVRVVAVQGSMQVAMIVVMAKFVIGL